MQQSSKRKKRTSFFNRVRRFFRDIDQLVIEIFLTYEVVEKLGKPIVEHLYESIIRIL